MEIPEPVRDQVEMKGGLEGIKGVLPPKRTYEDRSEVYKALSDPLRLKILDILIVQPLCVCCIKEMVNISDSKLSYHLSQLKGAGLIEGRQEKNWIIYRPTEAGVKYGSKGVR